jgi:hypothetical protein
MLPQFGYIVAQAGADSHTLPPPTNASLAPLLNKPFQYGYNRDYYYPPSVTPHQQPSPFYTRPPSPSAPPVLPPPSPYVYMEKMEPKIPLVDKSVYSDEEPEQGKYCIPHPI